MIISSYRNPYLTSCVYVSQDIKNIIQFPYHQSQKYTSQLGYTSFYWKIDLHNFLHFVALRADHHAQLEIRKYAEVMIEILKEWVPLVYEAFIDYKINGVFVSSAEKELIGRKVEDISHLSKTEQIEFDSNWPWGK